MLTVKQVEKDGRENITETHSVTFAIEDGPADGMKIKRLYSYSPTGTVVFSSGRHFIMNTDGQTVGSYDLD